MDFSRIRNMPSTMYDLRERVEEVEDDRYLHVPERQTVQEVQHSCCLREVTEQTLLLKEGMVLQCLQQDVVHHL